MHTPISYNNLPRHDTTLLDSKRQKVKIKIPGTPPSLEQAKGMPLPKEISLLILDRSLQIFLMKDTVLHPNNLRVLLHVSEVRVDDVDDERVLGGTWRSHGT